MTRWVQLLFPKLRDGRWDFDVLSLLQLLLTLDQVVHPIDHQLDQLHLKIHKQQTSFRQQNSGSEAFYEFEVPKRWWSKYMQYGWLTLTSDLPRRSLLEMSKVSPVAAVSTPPVPLFCSRRLSRILGKRGSCRYQSFVNCCNHSECHLFPQADVKKKLYWHSIHIGSKFILAKSRWSIKDKAGYIL